MNTLALHPAALAIALCACLTVAAPAQSPACASTPADRAAVVSTMRAMYAAATADDLARFEALVLPGFYAYDNGVRFNGDAVMKMVTSYHAKGAKFVWTVTQPDVHMHCDTAWIAYVNTGSIQTSADQAPVPTTWLESATLERRNGTWKLAFLHSTRVPAPAAPR